jgi:hypothetical protein
MESDELLTTAEAARRLGVGVTTAYAIAKKEPDVVRITTPGHQKPMVRWPRFVIERILRRSRVA